MIKLRVFSFLVFLAHVFPPYRCLGTYTSYFYSFSGYPTHFNLRIQFDSLKLIQLFTLPR